MNFGGPARHVLALHKHLSRDRFDTLLIAGSSGEREGDLLDVSQERSRVRRLATLRREILPLSDAVTLLALIRTFRQFRPHVVHTHMAKAGLLGRLAARLAGVPIVLHTFHGTVFSGYFKAHKTLALVISERLLGRLTTRVIVISSRLHEEIRQLDIVAEHKVAEIPLGIELEAFSRGRRGQLRRELGVDSSVPLIGTVARLVPIKRVDTFIEAAAVVIGEVHDARFVIVGDGPLREGLVRLAASLGIAEQVHFLGWRTDMADIYADLDLVALTSRNEGTPAALIEAMAAARPVISTSVGSVPELLGEGAYGRLVQSHDPVVFANGVRRALQERAEAERAAKRGQEHVLKTYGAPASTDQIARLYEQLVDADAARRHSFASMRGS